MRGSKSLFELALNAVTKVLLLMTSWLNPVGVRRPWQEEVGKGKCSPLSFPWKRGSKKRWHVTDVLELDPRLRGGDKRRWRAWQEEGVCEKGKEKWGMIGEAREKIMIKKIPVHCKSIKASLH